MNQLIEWLSRGFSSWKFWVVVAPWEVGIRVRLGRISRSLRPGPHLRIPFLDDITLVNTRLRIGTAPSVTLAGKVDGKVRVVTPVVGYRIHDPNAAIQRYSHLCKAGRSKRQAKSCSLRKRGIEMMGDKEDPGPMSGPMSGMAEMPYRSYDTEGLIATPGKLTRSSQRDHLNALRAKYSQKVADVDAALKALDENPGVEAVMEAVQKALWG